MLAGWTGGKILDRRRQKNRHGEREVSTIYLVRNPSESLPKTEEYSSHFQRLEINFCVPILGLDVLWSRRRRIADD